VVKKEIPNSKNQKNLCAFESLWQKTENPSELCAFFVFLVVKKEIPISKIQIPKIKKILVTLSLRGKK
jgi:hypothetical protein